MAAKPPSTEKPAQTFETALGRLEAIVSEMEGDKLPLEQLLERYEEGSKLVKVCQEKLELAERRIEIITRNAAGKPQVTEFEPVKPASAALAPAAAATAPADEVSLF